MFHYGKTPNGDLEISVSGTDIRMFYRAVSDSGLLSRRDMYPFKTYIEENYVAFLDGSKPLSEFDAYAAALHEIGLDEVLAACQEAYDAYMAA